MADLDRNMRLLDGRRVQIADLIEAGLVHVGSTLEFHRPRVGQIHSAEVTSAGRLRTQDGQEFTSPSSAASKIAGVAVDGWDAWTVGEGGPSLFALREKLLTEARVVVQSQSKTGVEGNIQTLRHDYLRDARTAAETGEPKTLKVRDLVSLWDAKRRGYLVLDSIEADLANHGLDTRPDFRKVSLDTEIELVARAGLQSDSYSAEEAVKGDTEPESGKHDLGLTLGNLPSALGGIVSVNPSENLVAAMTIMRLCDYSQIAVMTTPRTLQGAITWRSIAKALSLDPNAHLLSALEPATEHRYDRDLIDILPEISSKDFVFVRNAVNEVSGIVTTADVVQIYGETATPYFIIGEIDHLLRRFIAEEWSSEEVIDVCDPEHIRHLESCDDLTFGDYQKVLEDSGRFHALGWPIDRTIFMKRLNEVRNIRNGIAHFDPDPIAQEEVAELRLFLSLLRELRPGDSD